LFFYWIKGPFAILYLVYEEHIIAYIGAVQQDDRWSFPVYLNDGM